jgi:catechol 2,3-dioxygenase-like lactoylglutathione lyase family enzyme
MAQIRYLVKNVDEAVRFYTKNFGFHLDQQFGPAMAIVSREDL